MMQKLWENIKKRQFFYLVDSLIVGVFVYFHLTSGAYSIRNFRLAESYGLLAAVFLYLAVLAAASGKLWTGYYIKKFVEQEKAFFASSILLAGFHVYFAFFKSLGGFGGLSFLSANYYRAFILGLVTIVGMALFLKVRLLTSGNIYLIILRAALVIFIFLHAIFIGAHFKDFTKPIPIIASLLLYSLLIVYSILLAKVFAKNKIAVGLFMVVLVTATSSAFLTTKLWSKEVSVSTHDMHMPAVSQGTRYTVSLSPSEFTPGKKTTLELAVFDAATGKEIKDFEIVHEKLVHLVIVDENLEWYSHIHPEWNGRKFIVEETLPKPGAYRAYASFQVKGDSEQVYAFRLLVGSENNATISKILDFGQEKAIEGYKVSLAARELNKKGIDSGRAFLDFTIKDNQGQDVRNLYPYLGAFGHLVMISSVDYSYVHVHPIKNPVIPDDTTGPVVEFMVMGNLSPGVYKLFGQFAPDKKVITVPFTVEVK